MPETASPPLAAEQTAVNDDVISPELVLVDPDLRDRLASLPLAEPRVTPTSAPADGPAPPVETTPRPTTAPAEPPLRVAEPSQLTPTAPPPPVPVSPERRRRRRWPLFLAVLVGGGLALAATVVLLPRGKPSAETARVVDPASTGHIGRPASSTSEAPVTTPVIPSTRSTPSRSPRGRHAPVPPAHPTTTPVAPRTTPRTTPTTKHAPKTKTTPATKPPPAATQDKLAWAPAPGATAYDIDLLRGSKRVFHVRTHQTSIIVAVRRGARGPAGSLPPGHYQWIVWPVVGGKRLAQAIVRSPLNLPS
jgi:hypothetical protein